MPRPQSAAPEHVAQYLRDYFLVSFAREADPGHWDPEHDKGSFAIPLLCLSHWYAMAGFVAGTADASAPQVVAAMSEYLGQCPEPFGARYRRRSAALVALFRHGLAHQREPGDLRLDVGTLSWVVGRDLPEAEHMSLVGPVRRGQARRAFGVLLGGPFVPGDGHLPRYFIGVHADSMFRHSALGFEAVVRRCEQDPDLAARIYAGVDEAVSPRRPRSAEVRAALNAALADADPFPWQRPENL